MVKLRPISHPVVLRNGSSVLIRSIRPDDKQRLLGAFHRSSSKSIYFRFFGVKKELTEKDLTYFTEIDFEHHGAIVASIIKNGEEEIVGVGRYIELKGKGKKQVAELAFIVDDEHQGLGVGTVLFEEIVSIAKNNGFLRLEAEVLLDNEKMLEIFQHSGYKNKTTNRNGVAHIEFGLEGQEVKNHSGG